MFQAYPRDIKDSVRIRDDKRKEQRKMKDSNKK